MTRDSNKQDEPGAVEDRYTSDQDRTLSDAVLEAIQEYKGEDVSKSDFVLYDDINPDALDNLFRHDANPRTHVGFDTDDVRVELYGDGGIEIRVRGKPPEGPS